MSSYSGKCMRTKNVYIHGQNGLNLAGCMEEKSFLWKRLRLDLIFPRLWTFFFRTLIPLILLPETLLAAPISFQEKKSQDAKTQNFFLGLQKFEFFSPNFIFKFFSRNFFPATFLHRFLQYTCQKISLGCLGLNLCKKVTGKKVSKKPG